MTTYFAPTYAPDKPANCFFCGNVIKEDDPIRCVFSMGAWSGDVMMLCCKRCAADHMEIVARQEFWKRLVASGQLDKNIIKAKELYGVEE